MDKKIEYYINILGQVLEKISLRHNSKKHEKFLDYAHRRLKCQLDIGGWSDICAIRDNIEDIECVKKHFLKYGIDGPTKYNDIGESLLRVKGVCSCIYEQFNSIKKLSLIFGALSNDEINIYRERCIVLYVRNKIASHITEYREQDGSYNSFSLTRDFNGNIIYYLDKNNNIEEYDIIKLIKDYDVVIEDMLFQIVKKIIKTVLIYDKKEKEKIIDRLEKVKECYSFIKKGKKIIYIYSTKSVNV